MMDYHYRIKQLEQDSDNLYSDIKHYNAYINSLEEDIAEDKLKLQCYSLISQLTSPRAREIHENIIDNSKTIHDWEKKIKYAAHKIIENKSLIKYYKSKEV